MRQTKILHGILLIISLLYLSSACSNSQTTATLAVDMRYLTPIPQNTLDATTITPPLTTQLDAVIAARKALNTTRLEFDAIPSVLSAEELTLLEAMNKTQQNDLVSKGLSNATKVWLVIFEGEFAIIPPDPQQTITPEVGHGCALVIINADSAMPLGVKAGASLCPAGS